jgi:orotate phosphoribosyltransferase
VREQIIELVRKRGYERSDEPFELASGELSHDYIDGKRAVGDGEDLALVARAIVEAVREPFDVAGGLTMGADPFAHAVAIVKPCGWFSVRKESKGRGLNRYIEGRRLGPGDRVLLVDDVVTTGGSIVTAHERVKATGATVVAAITLVDRGDAARSKFSDLEIPYYALVTYQDLDIEPVGNRITAPAL